MTWDGQIIDPLVSVPTAPAARLAAAAAADPELEPKPRLHFDYFGPAMLTVFTLMTGEWIDAMNFATAASGPSERSVT